MVRQVLLKGPPVGGGEGRPRISQLKGPPKVGGEGKLPASGRQGRLAGQVKLVNDPVAVPRPPAPVRT